MRRLSVLVGLGLMGLGFAAPSAPAAQPVGGCAFEHTQGFFDLLPTDDPRIASVSGAPSIDGNGDGFTCVQLITLDRHGNGIRFVAVDNVTPL